jgi:uncharacterized phage protein gp47/JayE
MAGLTDTGVEIKDVDEVIADIVAAQIANIDPDLLTEADSALGQLNGIVAAVAAELWEFFEQIYQAAYPDTASGQSLSYASAMTGAIRQPATKASLLVHLEGTVSTNVPAGTQGYVDGDADSLWETTADAVIAEEGATDFIEVTMRAVETGPETVAHVTDTDLVISTPVGGLDAITIQADYVPGAAEETDSQLRIRREQLLALPGATTVQAIRADMLLVPGVDSCTVFENPTGVPDVNGLPPKSIEVMVLSETAPTYTAQDIVDAILLNKPAGTQTFGGLSSTATDSAGNTYTVYYSEPTTVRVWVDLTLTAATDGTYVGDTAIKQAVADWATSALKVGDDVFASDIINVVADIDGVVSVSPSTVKVDDNASPVTTDHITTARELATIATADVGVTSV